MIGPESAAQFRDEVRALAAQYPDRHSAVLPALRIAQHAHGGWLPPGAFEEVGDALELTPAYCRSVASFYDMFHLTAVGRHMVEVCTNICCGLRGAQGVLEAFETELGVRAGETTGDGEVTLRTVECLGGCAWPTVVALDERFRLSVQVGDVPGIVAELGNG